MDRPALRRLLLTLASPDLAAAADTARLVEADWLALDGMAAQHRMRPQLHALHGENAAVPAPVRSLWHSDWRAAALAAMPVKADLLHTVQLLREGGIEPLVLKGGWLAWHAYAHPALRPMRDLDLLVPEPRILDAVDLLRAEGYTWDEEPDLPVTELIRFDKSLPGLIAPRGTAIELHLHAWHPNGRLDYPSPDPDDEGMFARAIKGLDALSYPSPGDMLAHLIIHAAYSHRLDCGPLLLADIAVLLDTAPIDWPGFWARTDCEGWRGGARLVLDLVRRWRPSVTVDLAADPGPTTPAALIDAAADLMLPDMAQRESASFLATVMAGGPAAVWRRMTRRVRVATPEGAVKREAASEGNFAVWALSRLARTTKDISDGDVRRHGRDLVRLNRWLTEAR